MEVNFIMTGTTYGGSATKRLKSDTCNNGGISDPNLVRFIISRKAFF
jgi:hypothetical protein